MAPLIRLNELSVGFRGPPLLDGVTCQIESGQRIGLLGRNGSGKTTLMRILSGLIAPDHGECVVSPGSKSRCFRRKCRRIWRAASTMWSSPACRRTSWMNRTSGNRSSVWIDCCRRWAWTESLAVSTLSSGMKRRVLLAQLARFRARRAAPRRTDQPSRHRHDCLAGRFPAALAGDVDLRDARPRVSAALGHAHSGNRSRPAVRLVVRLRYVSGSQGSGPGGRRKAKRLVRQEAGARGGVDAPRHQGPPHTQRRPRAGTQANAAGAEQATRKDRHGQAGDSSGRAQRGTGRERGGHLIRLRRADDRPATFPRPSCAATRSA